MLSARNEAKMAHKTTHFNVYKQLQIDLSFQLFDGGGGVSGITMTLDSHRKWRCNSCGKHFRKTIMGTKQLADKWISQC